MMVCYDDRHTKRFSILNFFRCRNSVIAGNDRINSIFMCPVDQMLI